MEESETREREKIGGRRGEIAREREGEGGRRERDMG